MIRILHEQQVVTVEEDEEGFLAAVCGDLAAAGGFNPDDFLATAGLTCAFPLTMPSL